MATVYWIGKATAVAQVSTATFATYDVATTRTITIGGVAISAADSGGTLTGALAALATLLNASTHPYFSAITWTSDSTKIMGTAKTAGVPFIFAGSVSGGTGTLTDAFTTTTASAGPNDWSTADNWSGGAVPVDNDTVIIESGGNISWGLAQTGIYLTKLVIRQTYTGLIGLRRTGFATSSDGETFSATEKPEYREDYLTIGATTLVIGEHYGSGSPQGSGRIKIDLGSTASTVSVMNTGRTPEETGLEVVRLLANSASTNVYVRSAPGGVGIAVDAPTETSTVGTISIAEASVDSRVHAGSGTTVTAWDQRGGSNVLEAAATVTTVTVSGGTLAIEGTFAVTTLNVEAGDVYPDSTGTITTLNLKAGTVSFLRSNQARTVTTFTWYKDRGGSFDLDPDVVTLTNKVALANS